MALSVVTSFGEVATGNIKHVRLDLSLEDELTDDRPGPLCVSTTNLEFPIES